MRWRPLALVLCFAALLTANSCSGPPDTSEGESTKETQVRNAIHEFVTKYDPLYGWQSDQWGPLPSASIATIQLQRLLVDSDRPTLLRAWLADVVRSDSAVVAVFDTQLHPPMHLRLRVQPAMLPALLEVPLDPYSHDVVVVAEIKRLTKPDVYVNTMSHSEGFEEIIIESAQWQCFIAEGTLVDFYWAGE